MPTASRFPLFGRACLNSMEGRVWVAGPCTYGAVSRIRRAHAISGQKRKQYEACGILESSHARDVLANLPSCSRKMVTRF